MSKTYSSNNIDEMLQNTLEENDVIWFRVVNSFGTRHHFGTHVTGVGTFYLTQADGSALRFNDFCSLLPETIQGKLRDHAAASGLKLNVIWPEGSLRRQTEFCANILRELTIMRITPERMQKAIEHAHKFLFTKQRQAFYDSKRAASGK